MRDPDIKKLRTRTWFAALAVNSGLKTGYALESSLSPNCISKNADGGQTRSGRWYQYRRGEIAPSRRTLDVVDSRYPKTSRWFDAPLWSLLGETPVSLGHLRKILSASRPHLAKHLGKPNTVLNTSRTIDSLWKQGDLHALETLLAIQQHSEIALDLAGYIEAGWASLHLGAHLTNTTALRAVQKELLDALWEKLDAVVPRPSGYSFLLQTQILDEAVHKARQLRLVVTAKQEGKLAFWICTDALEAVQVSRMEVDDLLAAYEAVRPSRSWGGRHRNFLALLYSDALRQSISSDDFLQRVDHVKRVEQTLPLLRKR